MALSAATAGAVTALYGAGGLVYVTLAQNRLRGVPIGRLSVLGGPCSASGYLRWHGDLRGSGGSAVGCVVSGAGYYTLHNTLQVHAAQMAPTSRATALGLFAASLFAGQALGLALASHMMAAVSLDRLLSLAAIGLLLLRRVLARSRPTSATRDELDPVRSDA